MDMSKYKPLFLSETAEHLNQLEQELVALEQQPEASEHINEVFRHLHSVKSMSASMGYENMSTLSHRLEDLVAPHRDSGAALGDDEVDALLNGLDVMRELLEAASADRPEPDLPDALIRNIKALLRTGKQAAGGRTRPAPPASASTEGPQGGFNLFLRFKDDCAMPGVRAFQLLKKLDRLGRTLRSEPGIESIRSGQLPGRMLKLLFETAKPEGELNDFLATQDDLASFRFGSEAEADPVESAEPVPSRPEPAASGIPPGPVMPATRTVRVRTELLDLFVDSIGELITLRSFFEDLAERTERSDLRDGVRRLRAVTRRLQDRVMEVRMVPMSLLSQRLPRICRDVARASGKQVQFEVSGDDVELDRVLVEALDAPMQHLLRNAIDHGIEPPEDRQAAGKPEVGRIHLDIARRQDRVEIRLSDDGRGIDLEQVLKKARQAGLLPKDEQPEPGRILDCLFQPGFSTREVATTLSGRGVGLDAVREALEKLGGHVRIENHPAAGTTFVLDVPLTLAILQVLLVQAGPHLLALPGSRVIRAVPFDAGRVSFQDGKAFLQTGDDQLPFVALLSILERNPGPWLDRGEVLLLKDHKQPRLALGVDHVAGHRELVLKAAHSLLRGLGPYNGTSVLGDGRPVLLIDVDSLLLDSTRNLPRKKEND